MRKCPRCHEEKSADEFSGARCYCRACVNEYQRKWRGENKSATHRYSRIGHLRRNYGITLEEYDRLLSQQDGQCAICGTNKPGGSGKYHSRYMHVDHDHSTGAVRGLLCSLCNKGLGCFLDSQTLLIRAGGYLNGHLIPNPGTIIPNSGIDLGQPDAAASAAIDELLPPGTPPLEIGD